MKLRISLFSLIMLCMVFAKAQDPFPHIGPGDAGLYVDGFEKKAETLSCLEGFQTLALIIPMKSLKKRDHHTLHIDIAVKGILPYVWESTDDYNPWIRKFIYRGYFFVWLVHPTDGFFADEQTFTEYFDKDWVCNAEKKKKVNFEVTIWGRNYRTKMENIPGTADYKKVTYLEHDMTATHYFSCHFIPDNNRTRAQYPGVKPKERRGNPL